jgi:hypothetical protein
VSRRPTYFRISRAAPSITSGSSLRKSCRKTNSASASASATAARRAAIDNSFQIAR